MAYDIGYDIANSDDETQAKLLNGLCKGLASSMDSNSLNTQLCYIADKLDSKAEKVLKELIEFINLKSKE
jgi:hypothetical protein